MTDITIRDLIIYYTAKAEALKSCALYHTKSIKTKEELLELSERFSDKAYQLAEISKFVGKSSTTELNLLDYYEVEEKLRKKKFKERYGFEKGD